MIEASSAFGTVVAVVVLVVTIVATVSVTRVPPAVVAVPAALLVAALGPATQGANPAGSTA